MAALEIMKDFFFIERGFLNGNHFAYRSDKPVLIDTGYITHFHETAESLSAVGIDVYKTRQIINTHCHCDHIGGNRTIQQQSGCDIALHTIGKHFIDTKDDWSTWSKYFHQEAAFFDCTQAIEDGDTVLIGPYEFTAIHTPGHASDGIVLFNKKEGVLISSDTLWERDMAVINIRIEGNAAVFQMLSSLDKIEGLDVKVVYPGHGQPFTNMRKAISKSRKRLKNYLKNREAMGTDLIKKIIVYTLMMKGTIKETSFFPYLMTTHWFKETVDLYFNGEYERKYDDIMVEIIQKGIVMREKDCLITTVKQ